MVSCFASLARAIRPVPMKIISISKGKSSGAQTMAAEWSDKLQRFARLEETQMKPNPLNAKDNEVAKTQEGERLLKALDKSDKLIVLDERGRSITTEQFADLLVKASDESWSKIVFAIGGPYGHSQQVRDRADDTIRLSNLVLNHSVAHIVLLEQLYRAHSLLKGEPYHHV